MTQPFHHVVFHAVRKTEEGAGSGFGSLTVQAHLNTAAQLDSLAEMIKKTHDLEGVTIINWKEIAESVPAVVAPADPDPEPAADEAPVG